MSSVHDNYVYAYVVDCEHRRLILHTSYPVGDTQEYTDAVFIGVVAHFFEYVLRGNILNAIQEITIESLIEQNAELFKDTWRYAWPILQYKGDLGILQNWLHDHSIHAFDVISSYGLSGWVLAESSELVARTGPFLAT
jgi:hypothetical protein